MSVHPLVERAQQADVRKARAFRAVAAALTGEQLAGEFEQEQASAPSRSGGGRRHLVAPNRKLAQLRRPHRDSEHAAMALLARQKDAERGLLLPEDIGHFEPLHAGVILKSAVADRARGADDPNYGVGTVDLAGIGPDDRLCLAFLRYLAPSAKRVSPGDTPLRALLEALVQSAVAWANRAPLLTELAARAERPFADAPPFILLIGSPRYWELQRAREAQKGAGWIRELARLAEEFTEASGGVNILYLGLRVAGDPGWRYEASGPVFEDEVRLLPAWEHGAGRVKPPARPRKRRRFAEPEPPSVVEPDLARPVRRYEIGENYASGDRIKHSTLGLGVVQGIAGDGKIRVQFDEKESVLVHRRP